MPRRATLLLLALVAGACQSQGAERPMATIDGAVDIEGSAAAVSDSPDGAAVAAVLEDDEMLDRENAASYRQRRHSMAHYAECLAQADGLPEPASERIVEACGRLEDAPRR
jgi:hypothetical protein